MRFYCVAGPRRLLLTCDSGKKQYCIEIVVNYLTLLDSFSCQEKSLDYVALIRLPDGVYE